jgi:hypothetical protein
MFINIYTGNSCECVTITNSKKSELLKPAIVISARIHPGESNSSYMMNGVIDFLVSENPEAKLLRDTFLFQIIPMLNPDGVIHGNYRCSLMGTDLNRRYRKTDPSLFPTVFALKKLLQASNEKRGVLLFLDLHGHSKKKNAFLYGSDCTIQSEKLSNAAIKALSPEEIISRKIFARSFPKVLSTLSDYFSYRDSAFHVKDSKKGTGRVVSWREIGRDVLCFRGLLFQFLFSAVSIVCVSFIVCLYLLLVLFWLGVYFFPGRVDEVNNEIILF